VEPQLPPEPLPTAPMLGELTVEQAVEPEEPVEIEAEPVTEPPPTAELPAEPVAVAEVTPEEVAVAEPTEDQAQPQAPMADPTTSGALKLPAEVLLHLLPAELLNRPVEDAAERLPDQSFSFEWETIAPQLERGEVRVPAAILLGQMPREVLAASAGEFLNTLPADGIELPLAEIVARLPLQFFAPPPDQAQSDALTDEPPIFHEDSDGPAPQPPAEEAQVAPAPPASPALAVDAQQEPTPVEEPSAAPMSAGIAEAAPAVTVSPGDPETAAGQPPTDETAEDRAPEPPEAPRPPIVKPPPDPMAQPAEEAPTEAVAPLLETPPERVGEQVISSAIAALQKKLPAEEEQEDEAGEGAPAEHQLPPAAEQEASPVEEAALPAQVSHDEPQAPPAETVAAPAPGPAMAEQAPTPQEEAPAAEPALARATIDAGIEDDLRAALEGVDCRGVELVSSNGASIVVAHSSPDISADQADSLAELVKSIRHIVAHTGAGSLRSALLIGTEATTFVGSPANPRSPHLVVATNNASAGQATVAARRAMAVLESLEIAERPCEDASGGRPDGQPAADERLRRIASIAGPQAGGFRSQDGFGVVAFGLETQPTPETAAASEAVWKAAQRAQPGGADRLLVLGSARTLGLALAEGADALIVAGFAPGMNPGLVGTETAKIVRMCNGNARKEGMPADVG